MAKNEKRYLVGDEATVTGVVTHVGDNGGNPEYTVAVNNEDTERPISVPQGVAPQAFANSQSEVLRMNEEATKEKDAQAKEEREAAEEATSDSDESTSDSEDNKEAAKSAPEAKSAPATKATMPVAKSTPASNK